LQGATDGAGINSIARTNSEEIKLEEWQTFRMETAEDIFASLLKLLTFHAERLSSSNAESASLT
jgi:hypothetical protein